jgi:hypothetical protein
VEQTCELMEPDVFPTQLWVSTASIGAPRRGPSAAVHSARYGWAVDLDLETFFDRVNHEKLTCQTYHGISSTGDMFIAVSSLPFTMGKEPTPEGVCNAYYATFDEFKRALVRSASTGVCHARAPSLA